MSSIQGYKMKEFSMPTKRYCQTLSLKNNPILIEEYRKIHSEEKAWPEDVYKRQIYHDATFFFNYRTVS